MREKILDSSKIEEIVKKKGMDKFKMVFYR